MTGSEALFEELRRQKAHQDAAVDWKAVLADWGRQLQALMTTLAGWLGPAAREGLLILEHLQVPVSEQDVGQYDAPALRIMAPSGRRVDIYPHARRVFGAMGRVDILSGPERVTLLQTAPNVWKVAVRTPGRLQQADLTEEVFADILRQLLA